MELAQNRNMDQWNRIENPERNPGTYGKLIYNKGGKITQYWKDSFLNKWHWANWIATCKKKNEIRLFFNNIHKISTK